MIVAGSGTGFVASRVTMSSIENSGATPATLNSEALWKGEPGDSCRVNASSPDPRTTRFALDEVTAGEPAVSNPYAPSGVPDGPINVTSRKLIGAEKIRLTMSPGLKNSFAPS